MAGWLAIMAPSNPNQDADASRNSQKDEIVAFIVLAVLIWPVGAVGIVGGYGFLVWMYQIVFGPPGPPN
jgi:nitrate reductase NapE